MRHVSVTHFVKTPYTIVSIKWEVSRPAGSGSTECEAWRAQYEIEKLEKAGYRVLSVEKA